MIEKKEIEFIEEQEAELKQDGSILRGIIDGSLLTRTKVIRQLPFVLFIVFIGIIYISNRYHAEALRSDRESLRSEIAELRSEAVYVSSELMKLSRQTEVADEVEKKGLQLKESIEPPKKILFKNKD